MVVTTASSMPNVCCKGAAASAKPIAEQFPFVTIEPVQPRLRRCTSSACMCSGFTSAIRSGTSSSMRCVFTFEKTWWPLFASAASHCSAASPGSAEKQISASRSALVDCSFMPATEAGMSPAQCHAVTSPYRLPALASLVVSALISNQGWPCSSPMNRCPTVPVAPRTATLRLRIAVKSDVSEERRGEPAALRVDPAQKAKPHLRQRCEHFVVVQDVAALDADLPVAVRAGVVVDRLIDARALPRDLGHPDRDGAEMSLGRRGVLPDLRVVTLDERDAIRREVAPHGPKQSQPRVFRRVDERAHEQHAPECSPEVEILDPREDLLGALDEVEHLGVEVDGDDAPSERDQWVRDPAGAAAELENLSVFRNLAVDELRLACGLEKPIEVDGGAWVAHGNES